MNKKNYKIKKIEILRDPSTKKRRDIEYKTQYTQEISDNIDILLNVMNKLRNKYGHPMIVSSGWRPPTFNAKVPGAATHSKHTQGLAVDIRDLDGKLRRWVLNNLDFIAQIGLYMEDFRWTSGWVHFQCVGPRSKHRIFIPYNPKTHPPLVPNVWDGKYDREKLDY